MSKLNIRLFFSLLCALALSFSLSAQTDLTGYWEGEITQFEGGYRSNYAFELLLTQKGDKIEGRSYVYVDNIFSVMKVEGKVLSDGLVLTLEDTEMVDSKVLNGMEWCIKSYYLVFKKDGETWRLDGSWMGKTSFTTCVPGKVFLKKIIPRA